MNKPWSFLQQLLGSDWTAFSGTAHRRPGEGSTACLCTYLEIHTAPRDTGGTTANINIVKCGEM